MRPPETTRVLIADDDPQDRSYVAAKVASWGYTTETAVDGVEALEKVLSFAPHVVVSDIRMPRMDGFELFRKLSERGDAPPVILLTQFNDIATAISAMHDAGAFWYLDKPVSLDALQVLLERASRQRTLALENERLRSVLVSEGVGTMVGRSPAMTEIFQLIRQVATSRATVLITGESGTGKELVARAIHGASPRNSSPFVALNCAALPETLIESELFGHEKGAFTGAAERRLGRIELAHTGTLFLDEIGELAMPMQAKLLRVLEDSRVQRLGSKSEVEVDVRVVAATNRIPAQAIKEGKLREDLYYRLNVVEIHLPPLRERKEDIPVIAQALISQLSLRHGQPTKVLSDAALEKMANYSWPGNVRELRNVLERAIILCVDNTIGPQYLAIQPEATPEPSPVQAAIAEPGRVVLNVGVSLYEAEKALILATMQATNHNRKQTAEILGLSLKTIQIKLKQYRVEETRAAVATP